MWGKATHAYQQQDVKGKSASLRLFPGLQRQGAAMANGNGKGNGKCGSCFQVGSRIHFGTPSMLLPCPQCVAGCRTRLLHHVPGMQAQGIVAAPHKLAGPPASYHIQIRTRSSRQHNARAPRIQHPHTDQRPRTHHQRTPARTGSSHPCSCHAPRNRRRSTGSLR